MLKKQLAQIKARAMRLRNRRAEEENARADGPPAGADRDDGSTVRQDATRAPGTSGSANGAMRADTRDVSTGTADAANAIVEAVVKTGAVSRGADFVPRPRPAAHTSTRLPWPGGARGRSGIDAILAPYKTGEPKPIDVVCPGTARTVGDHTCYVVTARGRAVDPIAEVEARRFARITAWPEHVTVGTAGVRRRRGTRGPRGGRPYAGPHTATGTEALRRSGLREREESTDRPAGERYPETPASERSSGAPVPEISGTPGSERHRDIPAPEHYPNTPASERHSDTPTPEHPFDAGRILFLDIETAGLSANTYLFLVGVMYLDTACGEWVCEQVFARDYAEEAGVLLYIRDLMERFDTVVTYNGQSFDLPFIRTRMAVHRVGDFTRLKSVDLLYTTRRVFREILPNRRLTTVERHLRRVSREGDIPGRYIPDAWHDFVATGDARVMHNVLYHNRMDLFTMAVILTHLAGAGGDP